MTVTQSKFTIGLVQMACSPHPAENLARAVAHIEEAARRGAQIVCLQELFLTPYFCQSEDAANFDRAEPVPGPTTEALGKIARSLDVAIVAPVFERRGSGVYHNSAAVLDTDGELLGLYRKMHIPDDPLYYEKFYFTPGDTGFCCFDTKVARIGVLICWDQWYPEAARLTALRGAQVLLYPSAIGWHPAEMETEGAAQLDAWRTVQRAHAIANGVYVAAVNRVGLERHAGGDGIAFFGHSFVVDPFGRFLAEAAGEEAVLVAECDPAVQESVRRDWPFLRDRRVDAYGPITRRLIDP
jgi:N-carbamoylputrescine amidase